MDSEPHFEPLSPHAALSAQHLLSWAARNLNEAGMEQPRFEAQLILALALGVTREAILRGMDAPPTQKQVDRFAALLRRRLRRVPLAYLRGTQDFYGLTFAVTPATLVPRPETEMLVAFAVETLCGRPGAVAVDVGTGSGCIAIAAAVHLPEAAFLALDISPKALAVAARNARRHNVTERVRFARGSLLAPLGARRVEMILSNPPYIPTTEIAGLQAEVREHEPRLALDGGADGLDFHRPLIAETRRVLKPGGWIALEVAAGQAGQVAELLADAGFAGIEIRKDLARIERMVIARRAQFPSTGMTTGE